MECLDWMSRNYSNVRNVPLSGRPLVRERVVVLQVGAEPFRLEGCPQVVLVHSRRVLRPLWELVRVLRELGLKLLNRLWVLVEQNLPHSPSRQLLPCPHLRLEYGEERERPTVP